jgi:hypothetical protein
MPGDMRGVVPLQCGALNRLDLQAKPGLRKNRASRPFSFRCIARASSVGSYRAVAPSGLEVGSFCGCDFPLIASFSGTVHVTEIDNKDSVQLIFTPVGPQTITVTNPANGKSITGIGPNSPSGEIQVQRELVRRPPERDHVELRASGDRRRPPGDRKRQFRRQHLQRPGHARRHHRVLQLPGRSVERPACGLRGAHAHPSISRIVAARHLYFLQPVVSRARHLDRGADFAIHDLTRVLEPRTARIGLSPGTRPSAKRAARRVGLSPFARAGSCSTA